MARVKRAVHGRKHHRAVLEQAKGYYGNKSRSYRAANEQLMHSMQYAFRDRRARKGDFRKLWIQRINAGARQHGMSYSRFINGLHLAGVEVDRKMLADLAVSDPAAFAALVATAQDALPRDASTPWPRSLPEPAAGLHAPAGPPAARAAAEALGALEPSAPSWPRAPSSSARARCRRAGRVASTSRPRAPTTAPPRTSAAGPTRGGRPVFPLGPGVLERVADTVTPQPVLAVLPMLAEPPTGRRRVARAGAQRRWSWSWSTCGTRATPARCCGRPTPRARRRSSSPATRSTPTTPRRCGPRPAPSSTSRSRCGTTRRALASRALGGRLPHARHGRARRRRLRRTRLVGPHGAVPRQRGRRPRPGAARLARADRSPSRWPGRAESLNVGVACAVLCFEAFRQRRGGGPGPRSISGGGDGETW